MGENLTQVRNNCSSRLTYRLQDAMEETPGCVWVKTHLIGTGQEASVYKVCKRCELPNGTSEDTCQFAVKLYKYPVQSKFQKEVDNQVLAYRLGVAPRMYDAFICGEEGFMIMDLKQYTVIQYCKKVFNEKYNSIASQEFKTFVSQLENYIFNHLIMVLLRNNLVHDDTHLDNIMLDTVGDTPDALVIYQNPVLIDLSKMREIQYSTLSEKQQQKIASDLHTDLRLSFDNIRENKNNMLTLSLNDGAQTQRKPPEAPRKKAAKRGVSEEVKMEDTPSKKPFSFGLARDFGSISPSSPARPSFATPATPARRFQLSEPSTPVSSARPLTFPATPMSPMSPAPSSLMKQFSLEENEPSSPVINRPLSFDDEEMNDNYQTPSRGISPLHFDEELDDAPSTPRVGTPRINRPLSFGYDDEDEVSTPPRSSSPSETRFNYYKPHYRRRMSTRFADEEKEEMIDSEYYVDGDYDPDDEYFNTLEEYY